MSVSGNDPVFEVPEPKCLGDFEIVRPLGSGGMGVVYEAWQKSLNRKVALKVLSRGLGLTSRAVERFRREAEAAAKLHHTNIVAVYAIGEERGTHFYAMELIEGPSLDRVIGHLRQAGQTSARPERVRLERGSAASPPDLEATQPCVTEAVAASVESLSSLSSNSHYFDTAARMIAEVADALHYAHRQGVIHRDIKPSNLLLAPSGRLSLNDFGLARLLEQPGMTMSGEFVGTPAYMSPEQIAVGRIPLDHRTDIYSLGATLYEMLVLQPPFEGHSREQLLAQIVHKEPKAPRRIRKQVPVDLETICLKCLEKDPDRRYQSADALAEDLRRYVNRFAISARPAGPVQQLVKWVKRRPAVAVSLGCLLLAACLVSAFAYRARRMDELLRIEHEQHRLQLLDEKIRNAYLVASSGDLKRTDDATKEIEELGASTGQVRLLRGVVSYFRQDVGSAISELEQAAKLLPDNVGCRALLAMSYSDTGRPEEQERWILEMSRLSPSSPEDYLFKGYSRETNEPGGMGLTELDEGIRQRDSPLGRALRTIARANRAIDSGRCQDAEAALVDANAARGMLPDNPLALYASLYARLVAAGVYQEANLPQERAAVLRDAGQDVQALEPFIDLPNPAFATWLYFFEEIGNQGKALDVARRSFERTKGSTPAVYGAAILYQQGRYAEGLKLLDQRRQPDMGGDVTKIFLLAELPDGLHLALDAYQKLTIAYPPTGWEAPSKTEILLFLGRREQALAIRAAFRSRIALSEEWRDFYRAMGQFNSGQLSADAYLAKAGTSRWKQLDAHYQIGLFRLSRGDRTGAKEHFRHAVDTRAAWVLPWVWSKMFLSRLENDPKWPLWIEVDGRTK